MKKYLSAVIAFVMVAMLCAGCSTGSPADAEEGNSAGSADELSADNTAVYGETAEETVEYFIQHFLAGEYDEVLKICAVDELLKNYNAEAALQYLNGNTFGNPSFLPDDASFEEAHRTYLMYEYYASMKQMVTTFALVGIEDAQADREVILSRFSPVALSRVAVTDVGIDEISEETRNNRLSMMRECYGDDVLDCGFASIRYQCEDEEFSSTVMLLQFPSGWQITGLPNLSAAE